MEGLRFLTGTDPVPGSSGSDRYGYPQSYVVNPVDSWVASGTRFEIDASSLRGSVLIYLGADGVLGGLMHDRWPAIRAGRLAWLAPNALHRM